MTLALSSTSSLHKLSIISSKKWTKNKANSAESLHFFHEDRFRRRSPEHQLLPAKNSSSLSIQWTQTVNVTWQEVVWKSYSTKRLTPCDVISRDFVPWRTTSSFVKRMATRRTKNLKRGFYVISREPMLKHWLLALCVGLFRLITLAAC